MNIPKSIVALIIVMIVIAIGIVAVVFQTIYTITSGYQGASEKMAAPGQQGVPITAVQDFQRTHPDAFIIEIFGDGNFAPTIDQADDNVRISCLTSQGETTMTASELTAESCRPAAVIGIYGGQFAGITFGKKQGIGNLHAVVHQWGTNKFQSLAEMFMAFYSVKLPDNSAAVGNSTGLGQVESNKNTDDASDVAPGGEQQQLPQQTMVPDLSETTTIANAFNSVVEIFGDVSGWDVRRVENFAHAFESSGFRGDLSTWQPVGATDMSYMFSNAISFDGNLSTWDVRNVTNMRGMFQLSGLSPTALSSIMTTWSQQELSYDVELGANDIYRCDDADSTAGLHTLTNTYRWTVTYAGVAPDCTPPEAIVANQADFAQENQVKATLPRTAILKFDRGLKYWDNRCTGAPDTNTGETRELQCPVFLEKEGLWLDMWAKDQYHNTVIKHEVLAER